MLKISEKNNLKFFESDIFDNKLRHCFSTRINGENRSFSLKNSIENKKIICQKLEFNFTNLISPKQTHSDNIAVIKDLNNINPDNTDGIITNLKKSPIILLFADCTPILLYDNKNKVLGLIHAGWRGTSKKISKNAVKIFIKEFNCEPKNIKAVIGACISKENYEIDSTTAIILKKSLNKQYDDILIQTDNGKYLADLKKLNYHQLKEMGIEKIDISNYCTYSSSDLFFSYRKEKENAGRHCMIAQLD